jgi:23S rRNA maturation mini-RNase III
MAKVRKYGTRSRAERKNEAYDRNKFWATLSPQEQLESLNGRLGEGVGAKKQRARIQSKIDNPQTVIQKEKKLKKRGKNTKK